MTGGAAGVTADQVNALAARMDDLKNVTRGQAADALGVFIETGIRGADSLGRFTEAAIRLEQAGGPAIEKTAQAFKDLEKDPLQASVKLNESVNFLTESVYRQIQSLEQQGRRTEAAKVAQDAFADAINSRTPKILENMGYIERGWKAITGWVREAGDRLALMRKTQEEIDKDRKQADAQALEDRKKHAADLQKAMEYGAQLTKAINPVDALRQEYEAKLQLVTQYEQMMALAGVEATTQGEIARTQITNEYELQRRALAEQSFRSQSDANAFLIDSLNALSSSATSSIMGLIDGTVSAQDAMRNLAGVVLNEAVGALVQIGIQQIKNALISDTLAAADTARKAAMGAVYAASVSAQVAGMSSLAAMNAFAATAAIPIIGPALAPAAAALAGATAATLGAPAIATAPLAGARQYGGPVSAGSLYRVNEGGQPEMFTAGNGNQYLMPTKSGSVTPANQVGGGQAPTIIIQNMGTPQTVQSQSYDQQTNTLRMVVADITNQIATNSGPVFSALRSATNVQGRVS